MKRAHVFNQPGPALASSHRVPGSQRAGKEGQPQKTGVLKQSDLSKFVPQRADLGGKLVCQSSALSTPLQTFLWLLVGSIPHQLL